ncbi:MAG: hypothetical protein RO257_16615 [Candidatus Kapabacteria bacterium]|nr:hypothetical protein [Candidatus Kapabacteria bacterium]
MDTIEKYIRFIGKDLPVEEEAKLFSALSSDESLRSSLRSFIALEKLSGKIVHSKVTPTHLTQGIYNKLGYVVPAAVASNAAASLAKGSALALFLRGRLFTGIVSGIGGMMATFLLFVNTDLSGLTNNKSQVPLYAKTKSEKSIDGVQSLRNNVFGKNKNLNSYSDVQFATKPNKTVNSNSVNSPANENEYLEEQLLTLVNQSEIAKDNASNTQNDIAKNTKQLPTEFIESNVPAFDTIYIIRSYDSKFRFEFKNAPSWSFDNEVVQPGYISKYNNLDISILFPLDKTFHIGAEFRQETFHVRYNTVLANSDPAEVLQNPNLSTYSVIVRYSPFNFSQTIKPFGQISAGFNSVGLISRELLGIEVLLFDNMYMMGGLEFSQFGFTHKSDWYNSNKYGIIYGLGVKF